MVLGSTFLATGGGLPPQEQLKIFDECFRKNEQLTVKRSDEFDEGEYLVTIYEVGDAAKPANTDSEKLIHIFFNEYQLLAGITIKGIIPGEIGAEGLAFQAAAYLNLPVVDSDLVGGRAAPEIQMDCFTVHHLPITPIVGVVLSGKSIYVQNGFSSMEVEEKIRSFFAKNGGIGMIVGYPIRAGVYAKKGMQGTLSRAQEIGVLLGKKDLNSILKVTGGSIVATEKLLDVELESKGGFHQGFLTFENYRMRVKNEHMALLKDGTVVAQAPDLLVLLSDSCVPIHNADIGRYVGATILIVHIPSQGYWKEEKNRILWKTAMV